MKKVFLMLLAVTLVPALLAAQGAKPSPNPVTDTVRDITARRAKILIAAAEEMPAEKYDFHPTPAQMTFAELIAHMSGSNYSLCSKIAGTPPPDTAQVTEKDSKDKLVAGLRASLGYCASILAQANDSKLGDPVTLFGGATRPRVAAMFALTNDFYDHYSMAAMYLRLNGLVPPTAQREK